MTKIKGKREVIIAIIKKVTNRNLNCFMKITKKVTENHVPSMQRINSKGKKFKKEYGRNWYWNMSGEDKQKLKKIEKECKKKLI